jgi:hypothetical protein
MAGIILAVAGTCDAQVQEKKLIDRLLKPDTTLQNSAQGKQFLPGGAVSTKKATTKSFFFFRRGPEKQYTNVRNVDLKQFRTKHSQLGDQTASTATRNSLPKLNTPYSTSAYATHDASDAHRTVETSSYSGTRPFLIQGKSQKALSAQERTLTIDEVRELLNKNK